SPGDPHECIEVVEQLLVAEVPLEEPGDEEPNERRGDAQPHAGRELRALGPTLRVGTPPRPDAEPAPRGAHERAVEPRERREPHEPHARGDLDIGVVQVPGALHRIGRAVLVVERVQVLEPDAGQRMVAEHLHARLPHDHALGARNQAAMPATTSSTRPRGRSTARITASDTKSPSQALRVNVAASGASASTATAAALHRQRGVRDVSATPNATGMNSRSWPPNVM